MALESAMVQMKLLLVEAEQWIMHAMTIRYQIPVAKEFTAGHDNVLRKERGTATSLAVIKLT
jgi:hypothetical protein